MKTISLVLILVTMASVCSASKPTSNEKPTMILISYEGMPRAHLPAMVWFCGTTLPVIAPDEEQHDTSWQRRLDAAPKFALREDVYEDLCSMLMKSSSEKKAPYVFELIYESQRSVVRYVAVKDFEQLRDAIQSKGIKGNEVLSDWPVNIN